MFCTKINQQFFVLFIQTYFPAFEACVREGNAASIMCSYNAVNGVPSCANGAIQNDIVRKQWGFGGFFVSVYHVEASGCEYASILLPFML